MPEYVGVIDIGSNSVRLVVYDGLHRAPTPVFNERVLCGLGRSIAETGRLDCEGVRLAIDTLHRFQAIVTDFGASVVDVVATAAVRDSEDGQEFVERLDTEMGLSIRVLDGGEEARISALGVVSGNPGADGVMGDLGGGSIELVELDKGKPQRSATLPLGSLRLGSMRGPELNRNVGAILADVAWLSSIKGRTLFAVGGGWRALARLHIAQNGYPVSIVHDYRMASSTAEGLTDLIARMSPESLAGIIGVPQRRLDSLPATATTMRHLLRIARPREVSFSAFGVREGLLFDRLSTEEQNKDPLLAGCRQLMHRDEHSPERGYPIRSLYFDDVYDSSVTEKLDGIEFRDKYRLRTYDPTLDWVKLERKRKNNNYVNKTSVKLSKAQAQELIDGNHDVLLDVDTLGARSIYFDFVRKRMTPSILIDYVREAYTLPYNNIRVTFDKQLAKATHDLNMFDPKIEMEQIQRDDVIIMEIKYDVALPTWLIHCLQLESAVTSAISKYTQARIGEMDSWLAYENY